MLKGERVEVVRDGASRFTFAGPFGPIADAGRVGANRFF